jgi:hypothetical protein
MEQDAFAEMWDMNMQYWGQNPAAVTVQIASYYCPARRAPPQLSISGDQRGSAAPHRPGALADYACCFGDGSVPDAYNFAASPKPPNGVMFEVKNGRNEPGTANPRLRYIDWKCKISFADVLDGTANTLFIGEKHVHMQSQGRGGGDSCIYNDNQPWTLGRVVGPGFGLARSPVSPTGNTTNVFGSYHAGGICQFVNGDGSVRGFTPNTSTTLLGYMATRKGGEALPNP